MFKSPARRGRPPHRLRRVSALVSASLTIPVAVEAGVVETLDGSRINGRVVKMTPQVVVIETEFAGRLSLDMAKVDVVDEEAPVTVKLNDGTKVTGAVTLDGTRALAVRNDMMNLETDFANVAAAWEPDATPPVESGYKPPREWNYQLGVDIAGREGNSQEMATNVIAEATLKSPDDELNFYTTIERAERNGVETADETIAGASYTAYFDEPWGWYIRGEVERDDFENLDLRTTLGGGLSYRVVNRDVQTLELLGGLGYRYESFTDGRTDNSPTIEFGVDHWYQFAPWLDMENRLTFSPQVNDFTDYLVIHDSGFEMPIGASEQWKLRFGVRNDYNALPAEGRKKLDTSYYSRILLDW